MTRSQGMPFKWALNPYRGCTHACEYCYARKYQRHLELGAGDDFSTLIFVKSNLPDVLRRELARPAWARETVAVGTATDPYQPIEGHYKLTRRCLEALVHAATPFSIVTKGPMVVRDTDLLVRCVAGRRLSGVSERPERRRAGVGDARAGHRAAAPASPGGTAAVRRRSRCGRADDAARAGRDHFALRGARHAPGRGGRRRPRGRVGRHAPRRRRAPTLLRVSGTDVSRSARGLSGTLQSDRTRRRTTSPRSKRW